MSLLQDDGGGTVSRRYPQTAKKRAPTIEWEQVEAVVGFVSLGVTLPVPGLVFCASRWVVFGIGPVIWPQIELTSGKGQISWQFQESEQVEAVSVRSYTGLP